MYVYEWLCTAYIKFYVVLAWPCLTGIDYLTWGQPIFVCYKGSYNWLHVKIHLVLRLALISNTEAKAMVCMRMLVQSAACINRCLRDQSGQLFDPCRSKFLSGNLRKAECKMCVLMLLAWDYGMYCSIYFEVSLHIFNGFTNMKIWAFFKGLCMLCSKYYILQVLCLI